MNLLAPGAIAVPRDADLFAHEPVRTVHRTSIPAERPGGPDQIAAGALYLADPESRYTTGAELVIDGGVLARVF